EAPYEIGWSFGDGSAGSTQSVVTHTYTLDGNYTAVLTVVDKFGDEAQTSFAIESARVLAVGLSATPDRAIAPAPVALAAGVTGGIAPYAYSWTFGDGGSSSTGPEVAHTYSSPGTFAVDVTVTDRTGSVARQTTNVSIAVAESVTVVANTSSSQVGRSVELTAQANGGFPAYTYTWTGLPPGCSPSSTDIDACTPAVSGSFTVRIQVNDSAGDEANGTYLLVVGPAPTSGGGTTSSPGPISPALAIAIVAGVAAVALVLVAVLWMRRRRPPPAPDPWDDAEDVGPSG
ncbi:MAG TPA: PKD domain-containing protein, partial [Thermoplasmata archaeon]|nr:PKD domain-containing protein [Thermoplasmata archaeon]